MKTIHPISNDIQFNLAWEEYILKEIALNEDILLLWQNESSLVLGRNQNVYEEVNLKFIHENKIPLVRRISGGGTVYHDMGNINFTIITSSKENISKYEKITKPLVDALNKIGIPIEFSGKSDLKIEGKKVSGNAQFVHKDRLLHHGTLLFDSNLDILNASLKPKDQSTDSIAVKSNRSVVGNIKDYTNLSKDELIKYLIDTLTDGTSIELSKKDILKIEQLKAEKYETFRWNYGESPRSVIIKKDDIYDIKLSVVYGMIEEAFVVREGSLDLNLSSSLLSIQLRPGELSFLKKKHQQLFDLIFS